MKNLALISFREGLGKSQEQMAKVLDVSTSYYQKIEGGERNPSFNFIKKFKEKFQDVNLDIFFKQIT